MGFSTGTCLPAARACSARSAWSASGTVHPSGLAGAGVPVPCYHRTLPEYLDAFLWRPAPS
jgi:hypothetical protein